jgi:hypothetical protein
MVWKGSAELGLHHMWEKILRLKSGFWPYNCLPGFLTIISFCVLKTKLWYRPLPLQGGPPRAALAWACHLLAFARLFRLYSAC